MEFDAKIVEKDELLKEVKEVCESGDIEKLKEMRVEWLIS
jgi:hypothetical protein